MTDGMFENPVGDAGNYVYNPATGKFESTKIYSNWQEAPVRQTTRTFDSVNSTRGPREVGGDSNIPIGQESTTGGMLFSDGSNITMADGRGGTLVIGMVPIQSGQRMSSYDDIDTNAQSLYEYYVKSGKISEVTSQLIKMFPNLKGARQGDANYMAAFKTAVQGATHYNYEQGKTAESGSQGKTLSLLDYLKMPGIGGGSGTGTSSVTITGKKTAWDVFKSAVQSLTGNTPNANDFNDFYKKLIAEQRKYVTTSTGGANDVRKDESFNLDSFTTNYIVGKLKISGDLKGKLGDYQNFISQSIADAGLNKNISAKTQAEMIKNLALGKASQSDINDTIRNQAMITYSAFADDIKTYKDMSVKQILEPWTTRYADMFEISGQVDVADAVRMATGKDGKKLSSTWEYENALKADKRYGYTKRANSEATNLAQSFARAFGVNI